jgi:hypothetical protein
MPKLKTNRGAAKRFKKTASGGYKCKHSRINILQWMLTKLGTFLVLTRVWNPIDFQGQRSRSQGQILKVYPVTLTFDL